ncbi:MAG TPA: GGDEF domain-containing response regulator [Pyrinomonadaceae bacterium]|nr:GGDEF domain-containing response regulator [Pyrinomonadaceae bacterium]
MTEKERRSVPDPTIGRDRGRVLVISDDVSAIYVEAFESIGVEVVGVTTGAGALVSIQRSRPHVVVASVTRKGLSDSELARTLGKNQDSLPLIIIGADSANVDRRRAALELGAFDYFQLPDEISLLKERVKQLVELRIRIERLKADADLDPLTGLANRRRFRKALNGEIERWRRYNSPCALLSLDIDHLKAINDTYGHTAGDAAIQHVAHVLENVSRDTDTAARLGGEEFALLLGGIGADKALAAAERLRIVIAERHVEGVGHVTVSIGVAACPAHADSDRSLYAASDRALYVAKNEGRNRVAAAPLQKVTRAQ